MPNAREILDGRRTTLNGRRSPVGDKVFIELFLVGSGARRPSSDVLWN